MKDWVEVTWCPHCGTEIIQEYRERPNGLYGNRIECPSKIFCGKEFVVTYAILKDRDAEPSILERETKKGLQPVQESLEDYV